MVGKEMVRHLLQNSYDVTVYARGEGLSASIKRGARTMNNYCSLAAHSDILGLCVFSDEQMRHILFGENALAAMRPGSTLLIHTTGSPAFAEEIANAAPEGVAVIDATFSGGKVETEEGRLTIMAGGDAEAINKARFVMDCYTKKIYHVGPAGRGQMLKLLNNLLFATNVQNAYTVACIAEQTGIKVQELAEIISDCSGASFAMNLFRAPYSSETLIDSVRPYLAKDVSAALSAARETGLDVSAFDATLAFYCNHTDS